MSFNAIYLAIFTLLAIHFYRKKNSMKKQSHIEDLDFIKNYQFPSSIRTGVKKAYPHLTESELDTVIQGLRDYFYVCSKAKGKMVSMPSKVIDEAWHEFLLFTKAYQNFCKKAFDKFLHHQPAEAMSEPTQAQKGIQLAWKIACKKEKISFSAPLKIPLLFAIDTTLDIENGFHYVINCSDIENDSNNESVFCVSHIVQTDVRSCAGEPIGNSNVGFGSGCASGGCGGD